MQVAGAFDRVTNTDWRPQSAVAGVTPTGTAADRHDVPAGPTSPPGPVVVAARFREPQAPPGGATSGIANVVVALDGSATAEAAIPHSVRLAQAVGATLHLLRVTPAEATPALPVTTADLMAGAPAAIDLGGATQAGAGAIGAGLYLDEVGERLRASGLPVQTHVRSGPPAPTIAAAVTSLGADFLVLASQPHSGLARLAGSVVDDLLRNAPCPIIYVRTGPPLGARATSGVRNFSADVAHAGAVSAVKLGLREVPVDRITGSVGRSQELLPSFQPRGRRKDDAHRLEGVRSRLERGEPMPPLELYKLGYEYYVLDGHHRVAAARILGIAELEAEVTEYLSPNDAEQQQVFRERRAFERATGLTRIGAARTGTYDALSRLRDAAPVTQVAPERPRPIATGGGLAASPQDAWRRWYAAFFQPMQRSIRKRGLKAVFPGERSADILVRLAQFREAEARLGHEASWETALDHFEVAYGRRARARSWSLRDLVPTSRVDLDLD